MWAVSFLALATRAAAQPAPTVADAITSTCANKPSEFTSDACWTYNWAHYQKNVSQQDYLALLNPKPGKTSHTLDGPRAPWAANYLSWKNGGIARRWRIDGLHNPTAEQLSWDRVTRLPQRDLDLLSPVEKYDVAFGNADFKATRHELKHRGAATARIESWEGFCNGMRAAGALSGEPVRSVARSRTAGNRSMSIRFEPADIKALLGAAYFYVEDSKYGQAGANSSPVNPAALDVSLRLMIEKLGHAFFVDTSTSNQIWNETIVAFDRVAKQPRPPKPEDAATAGSASVVEVDATLYLLGESSIDQMNQRTADRVAKRDTALTKRRDVSYLLFLDAGGFITGGRWRAAPPIDAIWFAIGLGADSTHYVGVDPNTGNPYRGNPHLDWLNLAALLKDSQAP